MALIADRTDLPIIIDADTGFGNALNAQRTMRIYERAGAAALQVEDQTYPKRCGHLADKSLIPASEMVGKLAAMADMLGHTAGLSDDERRRNQETMDALVASAGNVSRAARALGITRMALRYRLQKHGIDPKSFA